jgi:hypothetical protein
VPFRLQAGDRGVRAITGASGGGITLGTSLVTGSVSLVIYRLLAMVPFPTVNVGQTAIGGAGGALTAGPRCYDGTCGLLWLSLNAGTASNPTVWGSVVERVL